MRPIPRILMAVALTGALGLVTPQAAAQGAAMHPGALAHALDRAAHTGRVLYIAAHPDDENTRLLAYLANARHLTVAYLSLTRGGGGQNLIGTEQGELLDVIRTHELLAARRIDGAQQRFTRARDFGYSKRAEEALSTWGHEAVLSDVVWVLRTFQPDVVITRFNEAPPNHGHHTASAILAKEAVIAAADPDRFPEQLQRGATVWKVERLMHNVSPWRGPPPPDALALDVGGYDVRLGRSYGEIAALSRSEHKSQGFGSAGERGPLLEHFTHVLGSRPKTDLLEGVKVGWDRYGARAGPLIAALEEARKKLLRDAPEAAIPALVKARRALGRLPDDPRTRDAADALDELVARAAGLFVRATAERPAVVPGTRTKVEVEVVMRRPAKLHLRQVQVSHAAPRRVKATLAENEKRLIPFEVAVPKTADITTPYWLEQAPPELSGQPEGHWPLAASVELGVGGHTVRIERPVEFVWTDRVHGERVRQVIVAPPATVTPLRSAVMLPNGQPGQVVLRVRGWKDGLAGTVSLPLPKGWKAVPASRAVKLERAGDEATVAFEVTAQKGASAIQVSPRVEVDGTPWSWREDVIDYPHLPVQVVLRKPSVRLAPVEVALPSGLVGYIEGPGDTVMADLQHVGVRVEPIDERTLRGGDLGRYAAIVVGIRAYNTREVLRVVQPRLDRYVEEGGTVVVQYNTRSRWDPLDLPIAPYKLEIGRDRVTDETAEMIPVDPNHPVLTTPNRLRPSDFGGWVQERGLYFAESWDPRFKPIFRIADPGEEPLLGGLLVAEHGRGRYVYTGLAFFRQLPAGVPGAYRLFANLIGTKPDAT